MPLPTTDLIAQFTAKAGTTLVSNELDQWTSQINGADVLSAASAARRPDMTTVSINGVDCPTFVEANTDYMTLANWNQGPLSITNNSIVTIAVVFQADHSNGDFNYFLDGSAGINDNAMYIANPGDVVAGRAGAEALGGSFNANEPVRVIIKYRGSNLAGSTIYINGVEAETNVDMVCVQTDGLVLGGRSDDTNYCNITIAEVLYYEGDPNVADVDGYLEDEWVLASDTTSPTVSDGTLTEANVDYTHLDITFNKATDDTSAQAALTYYLYRAASGTDLSTVSLAEANGSLVNTGGTVDVNTISDSSLTPGTEYEYQVVVEDEAGNKTAYTQKAVSTNNVTFSVTQGGSPVEGAEIACIKMSNPSLVGVSAPAEVLVTDVNGEASMSNYDPSFHYHFCIQYFDTVDSGTAESGGSDTISDSDKAWTANQFNTEEYLVALTGGTGSGQERKIKDNTTSQLVVTREWNVVPDNTTTYEIRRFVSGSSEVLIGDV